MDTIEEVLSNAESKIKPVPVVPVVPEPPNFDEIIKHMNNATGALQIEKEKLMSDVEKRYAEIQKEGEVYQKKIQLMLEQLENFCMNNLPKVIKQNVEGHFYSQSKLIIADVQKELTEALNNTFKTFGSQIAEYENQAIRATQIMTDNVDQPVWKTLLHGAKWLVVSLTFTGLILGVYHWHEVEYARKVRAVISHNHIKGLTELINAEK